MLREAYKLVESWEERNSMRFDIIVYVRPDLRFHRDLPFTYMDIDWHRDWILDQGSAPDWFWIMPRDVATDALQTLTLLNETLTTSPCCGRERGEGMELREIQLSHPQTNRKSGRTRIASKVICGKRTMKLAKS